MQRLFLPIAAAVLATVASMASADALAQAQVQIPRVVPTAKAVGLIIKYRENVRRQPAVRDAALQSVRAAAQARGFVLERERDNAFGARILRFDRRMDAAHIEQLARDIKASDPSIEY